MYFRRIVGAGLVPAHFVPDKYQGDHKGRPYGMGIWLMISMVAMLTAVTLPTNATTSSL